MSYEDRVRLLNLVDTALALSSAEIGIQPALSADAYVGYAFGSPGGELTFQVNHNDFGLLDVRADPLIQDTEVRRLLEGALRDLTGSHDEFVEQMMQTGESDLDIQLVRRGLTGMGLDLKEGGQRKALNEYRNSKTWLRRRKWFRNTLRWTDIVLGSLSSVPGLGVAVDPLKEWKESVEAQLDAESGPRRKK